LSVRAGLLATGAAIVVLLPAAILWFGIIALGLPNR
jgi:hypothetical protein